MRQSFKYGLLVVLALLLHSMTMKAAETLVFASADLVQEECLLTQAHPAPSAFQRFYIHYSDMPCEMSHADVSHIPTDKSFIRFVLYFRRLKARSDHFSDYLLHTSIQTSSDPVSYYVFGLRKIIV